MEGLNISDNIMRLRRNKKMTQEQLAEFIGVTKASVSKWENSQSAPDILLLPKLAALFNVTVDELIGYNPQLSNEQIKKLYRDFAKDFAVKPFEEVMNETDEYVKRYYSCFPFLLQISILWLNHYMLAGEVNKQRDVLNQIIELCEHIKTDCGNPEICNDAIAVLALANLQSGNANEVIEELEKVTNPTSLIKQSDSILIQAYIMSQDKEKAESFTQICIYNCMLSLIGNSVIYMAAQIGNMSLCEKTINRVRKVIETYEVEKLNPNSAAQFNYQAAMCYMVNGNKEKALKYLNDCVSCVENLFLPGDTNEIFIHGDDYFNKVDTYFEELNYASDMPRSRKTILADAKKLLDNPVFAPLSEDEEFKIIKKRLNKIK